jgi:hypothetical protein
LAIKQSLNLLYAFCLSLKHSLVFPIWQGYQISWAVIIFNPIQMVNNPPLGQGFPMRTFPCQPMFPNISFIVSLWVFRHKNQNITPLDASPPFPVCRFLPIGSKRFSLPQLILQFQGTSPAPLATATLLRLTAINAKESVMFNFLLKIATPAEFCSFSHWFPAIGARLISFVFYHFFVPTFLASNSLRPNKGTTINTSVICLCHPTPIAFLMTHTSFYHSCRLKTRAL